MHNLIHFPRTKTPMRVILNYCPYKLVYEITFCNRLLKNGNFVKYYSIYHISSTLISIIKTGRNKDI